MFKNQDVQILVSNLTNTSNLHPLEVVGRGSATQLQVGENLNWITSRARGKYKNIRVHSQKSYILRRRSYDHDTL